MKGIVYLGLGIEELGIEDLGTMRCQFERSRERGKLFTAKCAKYYAEERKVLCMTKKKEKKKKSIRLPYSKHHSFYN
jgi:hypothetical protein